MGQERAPPSSEASGRLQPRRAYRGLPVLASAACVLGRRVVGEKGEVDFKAGQNCDEGQYLISRRQRQRQPELLRMLRG